MHYSTFLPKMMFYIYNYLIAQKQNVWCMLGHDAQSDTPDVTNYL